MDWGSEMWQNVIIANVGWDAVYLGRDIVSHMKFVEEHGNGAEAYNFRPFGGLFYGYVRGGSGLGRFSNRRWTIIFVSKPDPRSKLRLVGWYEGAAVGGYRDRPEYVTCSDFPLLDERRFIYSAISKNAYLVPEDLRGDHVLPPGHRIGSGGIYYAAGGDGEDTREQAHDREAMVRWLRKVLPPLRRQSRIGRDATATIPQLDGVDIDDGGQASGYSPVPESEEHRSLREWVCANPALVIGNADIPAGQTEYILDSADRIDAAFTNGDRFWAVEVKSRISPPSDHYRGIFQCVKYRAVAEAMPQIAASIVQAVLVTENPLDPDHARLAEHLGIRHFQAPMDRN